jgi:SAM-dependent methyltransferase
MGICEKVILPKIENLLSLIKTNPIRMIELGNQHFNNGNVAKYYFESKGINHISIDLNGKDGALSLDLTGEINIDPADIVTNHGTSEHVLDQQKLFKNIDKLCKPGGYMVHQVPMIGTWLNHENCYHRYNIHYFENLASFFDYEVLENKELNEGVYVGSKNMIWCILRKKL